MGISAIKIIQPSLTYGHYLGCLGQVYKLFHLRYRLFNFLQWMHTHRGVNVVVSLSEVNQRRRRGKIHSNTEELSNSAGAGISQHAI